MAVCLQLCPAYPRVSGKSFAFVSAVASRKERQPRHVNTEWCTLSTRISKYRTMLVQAARMMAGVSITVARVRTDERTACLHRFGSCPWCPAALCGTGSRTPQPRPQPRVHSASAAQAATSANFSRYWRPMCANTRGRCYKPKTNICLSSVLQVLTRRQLAVAYASLSSVVRGTLESEANILAFRQCHGLRASWLRQRSTLRARPADYACPVFG